MLALEIGAPLSFVPLFARMDGLPLAIHSLPHAPQQQIYFSSEQVDLSTVTCKHRLVPVISSLQRPDLAFTTTKKPTIQSRTSLQTRKSQKEPTCAENQTVQDCKI
jgi:hypothetical protein